MTEIIEENVNLISDEAIEAYRKYVDNMFLSADELENKINEYISNGKKRIVKKWLDNFFPTWGHVYNYLFGVALLILYIFIIIKTNWVLFELKGAIGFLLTFLLPPFLVHLLVFLTVYTLRVIIDAKWYDNDNITSVRKVAVVASVENWKPVYNVLKHTVFRSYYIDRGIFSVGEKVNIKYPGTIVAIVNCYGMQYGHVEVGYIKYPKLDGFISK